MEMKTIIQCLIFVTVVSLAIAGIYASEVGEIAGEDASDVQSDLYISGSGDVAHVQGHSHVSGEPHLTDDYTVEIQDDGFM